MEPKVPIIGIVGGIGSGKSALSRAFEALGCVRIDADAIGHMVLDDPEVRVALVERFGPEIVAADGRISRPVLGRRAFADQQSTDDLNRIVGSRLWSEFSRRVREVATNPPPAAPAVVLDAALLYENNLEQICTVVVFVYAPDDLRRVRVEARRGWDWAEVERREARQISSSRKQQMADFTVNNDQDLDHLSSEAARILKLTRAAFIFPR